MKRKKTPELYAVLTRSGGVALSVVRNARRAPALVGIRAEPPEGESRGRVWVEKAKALDLRNAEFITIAPPAAAFAMIDGDASARIEVKGLDDPHLGATLEAAGRKEPLLILCYDDVEGRELAFARLRKRRASVLRRAECRELEHTV